MKRLALLLMCVLPCQAQILSSIGTAKVSSASTQVLAIPIPVGSMTLASRFGNWGTGNTATEANAQLGSPVTGTVTALYCEAVIAPSGGSDVIAFMLGGVSQGTCTITTGNHQGSNTGITPFTLTQGDLIDGQVTTLTTSSNISLVARVEGVTLGVAVIPFGTLSGSFATATTRFFSVNSSATTVSGFVLPSPVSGTLSALYVGSDITAGAAQVFTFCDITVSATCVSGGILGTCTMIGKNTACTGLTGTVTAGNLIGAQVNNTSGSTANFGGYARLTGVTASTSILPFTAAASTIAASGTGYFSLRGNSTTQTDAAIVSPVGGTAAKLTGVCNIGPAASGHTFTLYLNDAASALTFLTGANRYGSDVAHTATITRGQNISMRVDNSNTTTATICGGYLAITGTT